MARARDSTTLLETLTHAHLTALAARVSQRALHFKNTPPFDRPTSHQVLEALELFGKHLVRRSLTERRLGLGHNSLYLGRHGYLRARELQCDMDWADGVVSTHPGPQDTLQGQKKTIFFLYMSTTTVRCCVNPQYGVNWGFITLHNSTAPCTL